MVAYISYACISIKIRICGVDNYACITYMACVYMLNVHIVAMVLCPDGRKDYGFPFKPCVIVFGDVMYPLHAQVLVISIKHTYVYPLLLFSIIDILYKKQILLIVHIVKSIIC